MSHAGSGQLLAAALAGILTVVVLIVWAKFHPFIALILGTAVLGAVAVVAPLDVVDSFTGGFGDTFGSVGLLIALGAMLGKLLADSGGANEIVDRIIDKVGPKTLPWAMALIAAIIGLPMFFEIGVVILVPIIVLVARRTGISLMKIGIPALAGLSILHGLVPPHPGPVTAIDLLKAPLGLTLIFGLIVAVPTLVVSGPMLALLLDRVVPVRADQTTGGIAALLEEDRGGAVEPAEEAEDVAAHSAVLPATGHAVRRPPLSAAILCMVLPVAMMLAKAIGDLTLVTGTTAANALDFIGTPSIALLAGVLVAMVALGRASGMRRDRIHESLGSGLPGVASIMLIVAAGGGFKTVLSDSGVANVIGGWAEHSHFPVLVLGWLVAVGVRLATGSATVATVTTAGIVGGAGGIASSLDQPHLALLVLAVGAGSLFFSHVNDAGFWLVKEYFGLSVGQTLKTWSVMETVVSVMAFVCVLVISVFV
ncbi:MAG TPA: gluconate:H+ symporter [Marmoricola sp.]|nr:gluconate:H+ symporter [Marmoricola sp.]